MLRRTLVILAQVPGLARIAVVTPDSEVAALGRALGATTLLESGRMGLNGALTWAARRVCAQGAQGILIVPGDLPGLTRGSVTALLDHAALPGVVVAPDGRRLGTNALLVAPPDVIPFSFGDHSFRRHVRAARVHGLTPVIVRRADLAADLDLPRDLDAARHLLSGWRDDCRLEFGRRLDGDC
jgi:2-phospho-L-lactate guanylyltransferase